MENKTKIIATIGPSSEDKRMLKEMIKNGMDVARINTKYGNEKQWEKIKETVQSRKNCKIMFDIKGKKAIKFLKKQKFHFLAVSYAETEKQIKELKKTFPGVKIISKIETKKGVDNIDQLIKVSDGIMVARGDLGDNIPFEKVPITQKLILKKCILKNRMAIIATEMLLSLMEKKVPERAEVSDVVNAVLDGADAVMLSEETTLGKYPALTVKTMKKIVTEAEKNKNKLKI